MPSEVSICNDGLAHLGNTDFIESLNEDSETARLAKQFYTNLRDATLREWRWRFAKKVIALGKLDDVDPEEWDYAYRYPTDCVFARYITTGVRGFASQHRPTWEIMLDPSEHGRLIVTDEDQAKLCFTARVTDPTAFDQNFVEALGWRIAWALSMPLTKEPKLQEMAANGYRFAIGNARQMDAIEGEDEDRPESELVTVRR